MSALKWLDKHMEEMFLSVFLVILIILTSINVVMRYFFSSGLTWSAEISKYCLIYSGFISISYWIRRKNGIAVDALVQLFNVKVQKVIEMMVNVIMFIFFSIALKATINVMIAMAKNGQLSGTLEISMVYVYIAPLIGFGMALIRLVQIIILGFMTAKEGGER